MVGVTGSIPVAPTIFFNDLGASRLAAEEMVSTKLPRRPIKERAATLGLGWVTPPARSAFRSSEQEAEE